MSDESGFRPIYTVGEETDEMMEASVAAVATAARNSEPSRSSIVIPASDNTISSAWSTATGALTAYTKAITETVENSGTLGLGPKVIKQLPKCSPEMIEPYAKIGTALGWAGTLAFAAMDVANIWTAPNGLTSHQKKIKTAVHLGFVTGTVVAGFFIAPLFAGGALAIATGFALTAGVGYISAGIEGQVYKKIGYD
jgi:hypothetical protein